jgi:type II secretory pathway predicted ATPase ExeA
MDWARFGLTRRPFRPAVDVAAYYPAAAHEAAVSAVAQAFARRDPAALVDGPPGVGKSLVARRWLGKLPDAVPRLIIPNNHGTRPAELLQAILFDLNQPYQGLSEQELRLAVTNHLLTSESGHPTVLVIDEAQHLTPAALEELRLLGNIEVGGAAALFALLVGLPPLRDTLRHPVCAAFAQRVAVRAEVGPLTDDESAAYLRHQIRTAGGNPDRVFDGDAIGALVTACDGVPRVLNQAAGQSIELAAAAGADLVDVEAVLEALARLGRDAEPEEPARPARSHPTPEPAAVNRDEPRAGRTPKVKPARKRSA